MPRLVADATVSIGSLSYAWFWVITTVLDTVILLWQLTPRWDCMAADTEQMSLAELAGKAGIAGRTIRFYIARGLLRGPDKAGRGAAYRAEHLERLREIKRLQAQGLTLVEIARQLSGERANAPEPLAWWHYAVAEDVVVMVRADASPWRLKQIRQHLAQLSTGLSDETGNP
jgi:DNA-binding transcriptional MerR regulator